MMSGFPIQVPTVSPQVIIPRYGSTSLVVNGDMEISGNITVKGDVNGDLSALSTNDLSVLLANAIKDGPDDNTRSIISQNPTYALKYAVYVDKKFHMVTFMAVIANAMLKSEYIKKLGDKNQP